MKLEVTINREQFDLLITALVQIAQGSIRMAHAWDGDPKTVKTEKTADKVAVQENVMQVVWSEEEDKKLLSIVNLIGPRWVKISETGILPGRTPAAMSARYNNVLKNRK